MKTIARQKTFTTNQSIISTRVLTLKSIRLYESELNKYERDAY